MTTATKSAIAAGAIGAAGAVAYLSLQPNEKPFPSVLVEGCIPAHWCLTPTPEITIETSSNLVDWEVFTGTNPFVADKEKQFFRSKHYCSTNGPVLDCPSRITITHNNA